MTEQSYWKVESDRAVLLRKFRVTEQSYWELRVTEQSYWKVESDRAILLES